MSLSIGIVGLPNVGKSTLFNAITNAKVDAQNYPFCTIEPNSGTVAIPDTRLEVLSKLSSSEKTIYATIDFTDIAGLVKGASQGEGLGNKFLSNIREVSAIAHVVRCFEDDDITHVHGKLNPLDDIEVINTELILADLDSAQKSKENAQKKMRKDPDAKARFELLEKIEQTLGDEKPVRSMEFSDEEQVLLKTLNFLTAKKIIYIANVSEDQIGETTELTEAVRGYAESHGDQFAIISAKIEEELSELEGEEKLEFLNELGLKHSGLDTIAQKCFALLGLQTYLTTGPKETRAWTIPQDCYAPQAAGVIHTDFERGFIRANIVSFETFEDLGGWKGAKEKGLMRQEGKDYQMQDGDVVEFLFNV